MKVALSVFYLCACVLIGAAMWVEWSHPCVRWVPMRGAEVCVERR